MQQTFVILLIFHCLAPCIAFYASPMIRIQMKSLNSIAPLQQVAEMLNVSPPDNWSDYLYSSITTNGSSGVAQVSSFTVGHAMTNWSIPNDVRERAIQHVRLLVIAASEGSYVAQAFLFNASASASLSTLFTVAKKIDSPSDPQSSVLIQYVTVHSHGTVKQQHTLFYTKDCNRCFGCLWLSQCCCRNVRNYAPRGNTPGEMHLIKQKLLADQYVWFNQHTFERTSRSLSPHDYHLPARHDGGSIEAVERYLADDRVEAEVLANYDDPILRGLQTKAASLKQSSQVVKLAKISRDDLPELIKALADEYGFEDRFVGSHYTQLLQTARFSYENLFTTPLEDNNSDMIMKYVWILVENRNNMTYSINLLHLDITLLSLIDASPLNETGSFKIASDQSPLKTIRISVLTDDGHFTHEHLLRPIALWSLQTTNIALNILRFIGASTLAPQPYRMLSYFQSRLLPAPLVRIGENTTAAPGFVDKIESLVKAISSVTGTFKEVVSMLKSSSSTTIQRVTRTGFTHFQQKSRVLKVMDLPAEHLMEFIHGLIIDFDIPSRGSFALALKFGPSTVWDESDLLYSPSMNGTYRSLTIFKNGDMQTNTASFFIVDVNANLQMAPDLLIIEEKKSFLGGLWEDSSQSIREVPHVMSMGEALELKQFFRVVAMSNIAATLGLNVSLPAL